MPSLFAFYFIFVGVSGLRITQVPAESHELTHKGLYSLKEMKGIAGEDPVDRIVNEMRSRLARSTFAVHSLPSRLFQKSVDSGVEAWKKYQKERDDVENRFLLSKRDGSVKMFFEHVSKSGGSQFCNLIKGNERVVEPNGNCDPIPYEGAHWTRTIWQLGKTGAEVDAFVKSSNATGPFNAIANEDLMPATPSFGKGMVYVTTIRNPYTRRMSDEDTRFLRPSELSHMFANNTYVHQNRVNNQPFDNYYTRNFCGEPCRDLAFGALKEKHLDLALENLAHFSFVGPTEHAPCFQELEKRFSWNVDSWENRLKDLSIETKQAAVVLQQFLDEGNLEAYRNFLAMNGYDERLYNVAKDICRAQQESRA